MKIAILVIICSIIALIGFLIGNQQMFYVGGAISFFDLIRYMTITKIKEDKAKIQQIKERSTEKELKGSIRQFIITGIFGSLITFGLAFGLLFYFFSWEAFIWIGIVVGFGYNFTVIPKYFHKK
jgi:hypothetical protein